VRRYFGVRCVTATFVEKAENFSAIGSDVAAGCRIWSNEAKIPALQVFALRSRGQAQTRGLILTSANHAQDGTNLDRQSSEFLSARDLKAPDNPVLAFDLRPSTFDLRLSTFDLRRSTFDIRHSTFRLRRAGIKREGRIS
jgi:hypothetical protein